MSHYIVEKRAENWFAIRNGEAALVATAPNLDSANLICNALNTVGVAEVAPSVSARPIRGEFVRIEIAADAQPANNVSNNPFAQFHAALVGELARMVVPKIGVNPLPEEFEDVADYLIRFAQACDRMLKEVGAEVNRNATISLDMKDFESPFADALQGFATFELDRAASALREEHEEAEAQIARRRPMSDLADQIFKDIQAMNDVLYGPRGFNVR